MSARDFIRRNISDDQRLEAGQPIANALATKVSRADPILAGDIRKDGTAGRLLLAGGQTGISAGAGISDGGFAARAKDTGTNPGGFEMWGGGSARFQTDKDGNLTAPNAVSFTAPIKLGSNTGRQITELLFRTGVSPKQFGAVGSNTTAAGNDAAVQAWLAYIQANNVPGIVDDHYRLSATQQVFDFSASKAKGPKIVGINNMIHGFEAAPGGSFLFTSSTGAVFGGVMEDFFLRGSIDGELFRLGKADNSDAFNRTRIKLVVNNSSATVNNVGTVINGIFQCEIDFVTNCGGTGRPGTPSGDSVAHGYGTAYKVSRAAFNHGPLSPGNCNTGLYFTGYNYRNDFYGCDVEECYIGIKIDDANTQGNRFSGQQLAVYNFDCSAGYDNYWYGGTVQYSGGSLFNGGNFYGMNVPRSQYGNVTNPGMPATGVDLFNNTGRKIRLWTSGGTITARVWKKRLETGYGSYTPPLTEPLILAPGDGVNFTYTGTPSMAWVPFD